MSTAKTLYTLSLSGEQIEKLAKICKARFWSAYTVAHAQCAFKGDGVNVVAYTSGKVVIQGKKTEDFVRYTIEAEITGVAKYGYEHLEHPEYYEPHAGLDESGKGDLFGPLVTACVVAEKPAIEGWIKLGIQDSKKLTDDVILRLDRKIRETPDVAVGLCSMSMPKYNELYAKFGNLNKLLGWMHSKSLVEALEKKSVAWGMLDQFSKQSHVHGHKAGFPDFDLRMQTKAEADPVVAAASIVARAHYVRKMQELGEQAGMEIGKGASAKVKSQACALIRKLGAEMLPQYAKMHFKTAQEALAATQ